MGQIAIDRFSFKRVLKLINLDIIYNKNTIITFLLVSVFGSILLQLTQISDGLDYDSLVGMSFISLFIILIPAFTTLFCIIVFRRANKEVPMHISLIPAKAREKYITIIIEYIIFNLIGLFIFVFFIIVLGIVFKGFSDTIFNAINNIKKIFYEYGRFITSVSGDSKLLYYLNLLGFTYIFISPIITNFGVISCACISFNKSWKSIMFIAITYFTIFISMIIVSILLCSFTSEKEIKDLMINVGYYTAMFFSTLTNAIFIAIGYRNLKKKLNK